MAINLLKRAIIEAAINKGLHDIKNDPKRGIRNLVDLGIHFAKGDFQKSILNMIQGVLSNLDSSYYNVVSDIIDNIDHNIIKTFGMNIGFNSWTEGVKKIRQHQQRYNYGVPWVIIFDFRTPTIDRLNNIEICDIINQGKKMGIYSYIFFIEDGVEDLVEILELNQDCAFIVYVPSKALKEENVHQFRLKGNGVFSVLFDENDNRETLFQAIELLSADKCLFAVHSYYNDQNIEDILNDRWIKNVEALPCIFAFLIRGENCSDENSKKVLEYIYNSRMDKQHKLFLMDFYGDIDYINRIISSDSFFLTIEQNGYTFICKGGEQKKFSIRTMSLMDILSKGISGNV